MLTLRPYQEEAVAVTYDHLRARDDNPCVVIPTGGGKTPVIAMICKDAVGKWSGRVLILAHVKELLEQAAEKLNVVCPEVAVGIYSAGLKRRDTDHSVIIAGIQSVYRRACELDAFDLVVIDEAHMIPPDGDGMYRTFLEDAQVVNPKLRVIGLTATPFRMKSGLICAPDNILNYVCYEVSVKELIVQGYLCRVVTKASRARIDTSGLHIQAGEFLADEAEELMDTDELVQLASREILEYTRDRNAVLIFATSIRHGEHIAEVLARESGEEVATVFGETPSAERAETLHRFREGELKYVVNIGVLTTGFDAPNIDCVAIVRPTMSPGLYYQMVGRGFRLCEGKGDCLVLDFGGNVLRHGPVDTIRIPDPEDRGDGRAPAKECPDCHTVVAAGYSVCPDCGFEFPAAIRKKHQAKASTEGILSNEPKLTEHRVDNVYYSVHVKRDAPDDAPRTMRVEYQVGFRGYQSEWICFEHTGWARKLAESWWRKRSDALVPDTATDAVTLANDGALAPTKAITVRSKAGDSFDRVVGFNLGEKPSWVDPIAEDVETWAEPQGLNFSPDELPF